jgi:hypothetical protein
MRSGDRQENEHIIDFTDHVLDGKDMPPTARTPDPEEKALEETVAFIDQTLRHDHNQAMKNRIRMNVQKTFKTKMAKKNQITILQNLQESINKLFVSSPLWIKVGAAIIITCFVLVLFFISKIPEALTATALFANISQTTIMMIITGIPLVIILILIFNNKE